MDALEAAQEAKAVAIADLAKVQAEENFALHVQEVVKRVEPLLLEPDFTYAVMKTKSAAAANLCNWVINIINFNQAGYYSIGLYRVTIDPVKHSNEFYVKY